MSAQPAKPKPSSRRFFILRLLGTLLSLALLAYLVGTQGWGEFLDGLRQVPLVDFFIAFGLILVSRVFVTLRWYTLLRSANVPIRFSQCMRLTFMGLFSSNFLPSTVGGDLVRLAGAVYLRLDAAVSAASLMVDRLTGMAGMALLLPLGLNAMLHPLGAAGAAVPVSQLLPAAGIPAPAVLWQKLMKFLRSLLRSSLYWLKHPASLGQALLCTFGHMLFTFLSIWVLLSGMGQPLSFWWIGGLWSLSYFVSLLPVSINGLGLQEVSIAYLYSHFGGISLPAGLALAVLLRMLFLLASLPGVLFISDILRPIPALSTAEPDQNNL